MKLAQKFLVGIFDVLIYFLLIIVLIQFMVFVVPLSILRRGITDKKGLIDDFTSGVKASFDQSKVS